MKFALVLLRLVDALSWLCRLVDSFLAQVAKTVGFHFKPFCLPVSITPVDDL